MKRLAFTLVIGVSLTMSSCSIGLVAIHQEPPFICFKKKCRELAKNEKRNTAHVVNSGKRSANLNSARKKNKRSKTGKSGKPKKVKKSVRFN